MTDYTKEAISWDRVEQDAKLLAQQINEQFDLNQIKGLIAIARGGLSIAQLVAYYLEIRRVESLSIIGYDGMTKIDQHMNGNPSGDIGDGSGWIVIDDLVDTGQTFSYLRRATPKAHFVALYHKPKGKDLADLTIGEFAQDTWLDFPWEVSPLAS